VNKGSSFLTKVLLNAVSVGITAGILPGVDVNGPVAILLAGFILGLLNAIIKPILIILTLPITLLTLGLFALIINGFVLYLTALLVSGFYISSFWMAVLASIIISIVSAILNMVL